MFDFIIRSFSLGIFFTLFGYWYISSIIAEKQKPKIKRPNAVVLFIRMTSNWGSMAVICIQIAGWRVLSVPANYEMLSQVIGFVLLSIGFLICISARKSLGANWVSGYEYQIKQKQTLVTTGIYTYIRHPIYSGLFLTYIGGELVAQSMLWISFLVMIFPLYIQAKREEKLLLSYFGNDYKKYKERTTMFIPFVW